MGFAFWIIEMKHVIIFQENVVFHVHISNYKWTRKKQVFGIT